MAKKSRSREVLPIDIIEDILLRLPVKTLHRFCCISKLWYSVISHSSFHKEHYRRHSEEDPLVLVSEYDQTVSHFSFTIYNNQGTLVKEFTKPITITLPTPTTRAFGIFVPVQSCLGLVCIAPIYDGPVLLCDPSTQQLITLPKPLQKELDSTQVIGFGYGTSKEQFKVVRFFCCEADEESCCEIFTLGTTGGWRPATSPPFDPKRGVPLLHGALHLIPEMEAIVKQEHCRIASFNLDTESYSAIPLPESVKDTNGYQLLELRGSLCLVCHGIYDGESKATLWFLKNYSSGEWMKEYKIELETFTYVRPVATMRDGRLLVSAFDEHCLDADLCYYDPKEKRFGENWHFLCNNLDAAAIVYKESFFHL